ncbi:MAG: 50S ribosomal protein L15 [Planctomycetes bacterium]|nr:50S ribosomal protein L15 [Planctomycetota bacterium]MCZ6652920.1 50S ribosomal protein L15 [Planctomycetota bacterium]
MELADITSKAGAHEKRKRVGRGRSSGHGKTCGRGHKGSGQRAGGSIRRLTEGGQMPLFRRIPKRGFSNADFRTEYDIVNICDLDELFSSGDEVTKQALVKVGLLRNDRVLVKILGDGDLATKLTVLADRFSKSAKEKITAAGGTVSEIGNSR